MHFSAATIAAAVLAVVPLMAKAQSVVYTVEDAPNGGSYENTISYRTIEDASVSDCQTACTADTLCNVIVFQTDAAQCDFLLSSQDDTFVVPANSVIYTKTLVVDENPAPGASQLAVRRRRRALAFHANALEESQW